MIPNAEVDVTQPDPEEASFVSPKVTKLLHGINLSYHPAIASSLLPQQRISARAAGLHAKRVFVLVTLLAGILSWTSHYFYGNNIEVKKISDRPAAPSFKDQAMK